MTTQFWKKNNRPLDTCHENIAIGNTVSVNGTNSVAIGNIATTDVDPYGSSQYIRYRNWMETLESERNYYRDVSMRLSNLFGDFIASALEWGDKLNADMRTRGEPSDTELDLLHQLQHVWPQLLSDGETVVKTSPQQTVVKTSPLSFGLLVPPLFEFKNHPNQNVYHTCQSTAEAVDATGI